MSWVGRVGQMGWGRLGWLWSGWLGLGGVMALELVGWRGCVGGLLVVGSRFDRMFQMTWVPKL